MKKFFASKKVKAFFKALAITVAVALVIPAGYFTLGRVVTPLPDSKNYDFNSRRDFDISNAIEDVPQNYFDKAEKNGRIEALEYKTKTATKTAIIYLPPDYNENEKYDIIYFQGGANSTEKTFFGTPDDPDPKFSNMLDNMIANGNIKPMIAVCANFYEKPRSQTNMAELNTLYQNYNTEVRECLVPAVESKYSTFAESTSEEDFIASRQHRAFGGYSMGAAITWNMFINNLDYFYYFIPNCGGMQNPYTLHFGTDLGKNLNAEVEKLGYTPQDFFIYSAVGTFDITYNSTKCLINDLYRHYKDNFVFTQGNTKNGNITFKKTAFAKHSFANATTNFYNALSALFPTE